MTSRNLTLRLKMPLWTAVYAEASRTYETPSQVVVAVLTEALPGYVARRLRAQLTASANPVADTVSEGQ